MIKYGLVIFMNKRLLGSLALVLATVIWGCAFVAQSVGMDYIGPFTFQAVRCLLAVVGLLPIILIADRFKNDGKTFFSRWADAALWKAGLLASVPLFLAVNLQQLGIVSTDAGKSAFLTAMYIVIVPVIGLFFGRKCGTNVTIGVALAVVGLYLLSCVGGSRFRMGDLFLVLCAVMFALQITVVDRYANVVDGLRLNLIQSLICSALSAVVMLVLEKPNWQAILQCALPLSYAGFLSMGIAYWLQIIGQKYLPSGPASIIMSLESVFALLAGWLLLHERLTGWETAGCILMFAAVIVSQLSFRQKPHT